MNTKHFVNVCFDTNEAPAFVYAHLMGARRLVGERHSDYVVQFPTARSACRAIEAYKSYVVSLGYSRPGNYAECPVYAVHGNFSLRQKDTPKIESTFFYLSK